MPEQPLMSTSRSQGRKRFRTAEATPTILRKSINSLRMGGHISIMAAMIWVRLRSQITTYNPQYSNL
jgi:hypothetical protein